jgi:hypothetical protein
MVRENIRRSQHRQGQGNKGKRQNYLTLDYSTRGHFRIAMIDCIKSMIETFPGDTEKRIVTTPWSESLFKVNGKQLNPELQEKFHTFVEKGLLVTKRARQRYSTWHYIPMHDSPASYGGRMEETAEDNTLLEGNPE